MNTFSRRTLFGLCGAALALRPVASWADVRPSRALKFNNLHTGEKTQCLYFDKGAYVPDALDALNHLLRDWRTGDIHPIDPALFDQLHALQDLVENKSEFNIICGYRSPKTNATLHERSTGVATHSQHLLGKAIDVNLSGTSLAHLHTAALSLRAGGVGYYPSSDFIHMDTGRVRSWG